MIASLSRRTWIVLALIATVVWFANLDVRKLQHPDEGRYAEIAREMVATGNWVTPRVNGIKYFEKPALQYWLTAASFEAFGVSEWSARLPTALAGFLTVAAVGWAGAVLASPAVGVYSAAVLASCIWHFGIAHILTLDALLSFCLTLALVGFLLAQRAGAPPRERQRMMLVAYVATAAGILTKGVVALAIPGTTLLLYSLATRDFAPWKRLYLARGLPLLLLLAAPWFVVVSMRNPEFARFFFIHEHIQRFLTPESRRPGPWWYFLPMLVIGLLPWTGVFLWRLRASWRDAAADAGGFSWARFCLIWSAFILVFFSVSHSKLPSYILPMFPALALVLGWQLEAMTARSLASLMALLAGTTILLWGAAMLGYPALAARLANAETPLAIYAALGPWVEAGLGIVAAGYAVGWVVMRRGGAAARSTAIAVIAISTMLSMQAFFKGADVFRAIRSAADLVTALENAADPPYDRNAPFYQVRMYDQTLPFYLRRTTTLVAYRDEMSMGLDLQPELAIPRVEDWIPRWEALPQGYALMSPETRAALARQGVPMRVIASDSRRVLVERR
ncbi:MAG: phospholipid carrier-dependent glycosyltransferase [Candidatus Levyibacteriota bacterium]